MEICKICGKEIKSKDGVSHHIKAFHGSVQDYYDNFIKKENEGKCLVCNSPCKFISYSHGYKKFCSHKCHYSKGIHAKNYGNRGENSKLYGKTYSPETNKKISNTLKDHPSFINRKISETTRKKLSAKSTAYHLLYGKRGKDHPLFGRKGRILTEESKIKISKTLCNTISSGNFKVYSYYKTGYFISNKFNKKIWYRSSYERRALELFELNNSITNIENESIHISYLLDNKQHLYIPDFLITYDDSSKKIIEIKSSWEIKRNGWLQKLNALIEYCKQNNIKYEIWTERELEHYEQIFK